MRTVRPRTLPYGHRTRIPRAQTHYWRVFWVAVVLITHPELREPYFVVVRGVFFRGTDTSNHLVRKPML